MDGKLRSLKDIRSNRNAVRALFMTNGILFASWATRLPRLEERFELSHHELGMVLVVIALGAVMSMPPAGYLIARLGSRIVCQVSVLAYLASFIAIAFAPNVATACVLLFAFGAAHGTLDIAMNSQASEIETLMAKPMMSSFHALWSVGSLLGAVTGVAATAAGMSVPVHFGLIALLISVWMVYALPRLLIAPPSPVSSASSQANESACESGSPAKQPSPSTEPLVQQWDAVSPPATRSNVRVLLLGVTAFCVMLGEGAIADWSAIFLRSGLNTTETMAAMGYATFAITMTIGRFAGDWLSSRYSAGTMVRASSVLALVGLLLLITSSSTLPAIIGFACVGLGFSTIIPTVFSEAGKLPGYRPGVALAAVSTIGYFGFLLGPPSIGFAAHAFNLHVALSLLVVTTGVSIFTAGAFMTNDSMPKCESAGQPCRKSLQS
ncbi:Inner membrane protein YbjJ [Rubripirellula lacrimiformis]|uniref:Inner membrane protein YbjJ n=1 Tax=Rubripirellula lacrimiformis TaxID=1930273 RepID=A0A517NF41_9BACT|nr:MFS transporter [Rubripirellula lacrimiformis]QDT05725.1 Inner membrane protein YbjJ [Rubripirellula lacrimiformis]